jgi:SAM-dependent methyltransferase
MRTVAVLIGAVLTVLTLQAGAQAPERTPDIHYVPTSNAITDTMLKLAGVTGEDVVYDLGSGDGRIVIRAAEQYGARGVGIEIDPALVEESRENARKAGVADRVTFRVADLFKTDISEATVVTLYLTPSINLRLQPKFLRELPPGTRIVSHRFPVGDWTPEQQVSVGGRDVFFYRVPERE